MKKILLLCPLLLAGAYSSALADENVAFTPDSQTAALWNFQEVDGVPYRDEGPASINLQPTVDAGVEPDWKDGKFGKALSLPGDVRIMPASNAAPIALQQEVTVEAWIRISPDFQQHSMGILQYSEYLKSGFRFGIESDGTLAWLVETGQKEVSLRSAQKPNPGEWVHVAGTYDGHTMKIYVNGQEDGELPLEGAVIQPENNANFMIGYLSSSVKPYFKGEINGIRISNKALTDFKLK